MIRRFNYTGRVKIPRNRIHISLLDEKHGKYFDARLDLEGLGFPPDAKIYIEPNYKGVYQRFIFGTVSEFKMPSSTLLSELPQTEIVYFDLSIVDESGNVGLLLGSAKSVPVGSGDISGDRIPLLPVNPTDLGAQFWKLTFDSGDDGRPMLEINRNIPEAFEMAKTNINFISLVFPIAFRGVLTKLIQVGDSDIDEESWISQWLKFINQFLHIKSLPDFDSNIENVTPENENWIDECVNQYCKKFNLFEKFTSQ